jgi:GT2 family glycosyltransferase
VDESSAEIGYPLVSIIIPSGAFGGAVWGEYRVHILACVESIVEKTTYADYEIVVVVDEGVSLPVRRDIHRLGNGRVALSDYSGEFNFSRKINQGALHAHGDHLVLLNDDTLVITEDWIEQLLAPLADPTVAMTGSLLLFPDATVQHAGISLREAPHHIAFKVPIAELEADGDLFRTREVSGVTAACALVRRDAFFDVGGFSQVFPSNYNDVDFAMKLRHRGHKIIWTPGARLWHVESASRDPAVSGPDLENLLSRWGHLVGSDQFAP